MRMLSWLRARVQAAAALGLARLANRRCDHLESATDQLRGWADETDFRILVMRSASHKEMREIRGKRPESDGLSLAVLRDQICAVEQRICNAHAAIRVLRDTGDTQARRIAQLETRLEMICDSRVVVVPLPSLN